MEIREQIIKYREEAPSLSALAAKTDVSFLEKYGIRGEGSSYKYTGTLIPGNLYFFNYETDSKLSEKVKYIDRNPLIFYISAEKVGQDTVVKGIDLTLTPPENRVEIIQRIWDKFTGTIEEGIQSVKKGGQPSQIRLDSGDLSSLLKGTGYNSSVVGFKFKFMTNIKWVDYSEWAKIPFLKYTLVQGISINEIYSNYRSKLKG
jgi:hypothetical protein